MLIGRRIVGSPRSRDANCCLEETSRAAPLTLYHFRAQAAGCLGFKNREGRMLLW